MAQEPAGIRWLHVHPDYLISPGEWELVRLAHEWREGRLPEAGGVHQQAAFNLAAIEIVHGAWAKLRQAAARKQEK